MEFLEIKGKEHYLYDNEEEFRFLLKGLKQFSRGYEKANNTSIDYTLFKYMVDGVCEDTTESRELYWWCINRSVI